MFSTHFKKPQKPDERALRLLDLLARQAADIIERARMQEPLREIEDRLGVLADPGPKEAQEAKDEGVG
jgi:GAF domain-containing protein